MIECFEDLVEWCEDMEYALYAAYDPETTTPELRWDVRVVGGEQRWRATGQSPDIAADHLLRSASGGKA